MWMLGSSHCVDVYISHTVFFLVGGVYICIYVLKGIASLIFLGGVY